jgi:hypothetical protein
VTYDSEAMFAEPHDGKVHVHVDNLAEWSPITRTEEVEAAHFTSQGFLLPPVGNLSPQADYNQNIPVQILALDLLRKRAVISVNGQGACYLCSSQAQAQDLQFGANQAPDAGALLTAPFAFTAEATGPLWAVLASGAVSPPASSPGTPATSTGAANATTTLTIPSAGTGLADILNDLNWSFSAASLTAATLQVVSGSDVLYTQPLPVGSLSGTVQLPAGGLIGQPGQTIVVTITAGGAAITSTINATYTQQANGNVTVGVLQERRDQV